MLLVIAARRPKIFTFDEWQGETQHVPGAQRSRFNTSRDKIPAFQSTQAVDEMDVLARQLYTNIALHGASFVPSQMRWTNVYLLRSRRFQGSRGS
jgi:hypothetical protein